MLKLERNILFKKRNLTYPVSNTRARNLCFLHSDRVCEKKNIEIFVGGCSDVNYILETIFKRSRESKIIFSVNDYEKYIFARVFLMMVLMLVERDIDFIFQVRCSFLLTPPHKSKLLKYLRWIIKKMEEDGEEFSHSAFTKYKFLKGRFSYGSRESYDTILNIFKFWLSSFQIGKERVQTIRNQYMLDYVDKLYHKDKHTIEEVPSILYTLSFHKFRVCIDNQKLLEDYFRSGCFLSHKRRIENHSEPNPTFFNSRNDGEYTCHPSTNPFESFEEDEELRVFSSFKKRVLKLRKNRNAHYRFIFGDILNTLQTSQRKYDFIYTSNISDNLCTINLLLSSQGSLKNENSYLEVESMKMRLLGKYNPFIFYHSVIPFHPSYLPLLFGFVCVSEVYEEDDVSSISNTRETANSCRLYFKRKEFYPFQKTTTTTTPRYIIQYEFDFLRSEKDDLLEQIFVFLHILLKYKGVGISQEAFRDKTRTNIPISPCLTLNAFFLVLKRLDLQDTNLRVFVNLLLLKNRIKTNLSQHHYSWKELMSIILPHHQEKIGEIEKLLPLFQMEIECLVFYHFGRTRTNYQSRLNLYRMNFQPNFRSLLNINPILSVGFVNSREKISIFNMNMDENSYVFPMMEHTFEKLKREGERCLLIGETSSGEEIDRLYEQFRRMSLIAQYSVPQGISQAQFLDTPPLKTCSENEEEEEEEEGETEENETDTICWRMNEDEILCKIFVGGECMMKETPKFEEKGDQVNVTFSKHNKKFRVRYEKGVLESGGRIKFQRSKKRKKIILRIRSSQKSAAEKESKSFRRRILSCNRIVFENLEDWDSRKNEEVREKLSKIMFSMKEILMSRKQGYDGVSYLNNDHALRINLFYIMTYLLLSLGTRRIILQDKEQKSGLILCCSGMKKMPKDTQLPVFQVIYRFDTQEKVDIEKTELSLTFMLRIAERLVKEAREKYPDVVEKMDRLSLEDPMRVKIDSKDIVTVWASTEEQKFLMRFLEENQESYEFREKYPESSMMLVKRSVIYPLLTSKKVEEEFLKMGSKEWKKSLEGVSTEGADKLTKEKKELLEKVLDGLDLSVD